jgi:hypothetical protein
LTARDVKNNVTAIKNSGLTTDQVRAIFTKLSERNIGTVDGDGDRLRYRLLTGVDV